jgi:hypothetical protein
LLSPIARYAAAAPLEVDDARAHRVVHVDMEEHREDGDEQDAPAEPEDGADRPGADGREEHREEERDRRQWARESGAVYRGRVLMADRTSEQ